MYLALLPDAETLENLRRFAPSLPGDAHLTVIHSKAELTAPPVRPLWFPPLVAESRRVSLFGPARNLIVLELEKCSALEALRFGAERALRSAELPWSAEWPFSPHVTLGKRGDRTVGLAPKTLVFGRLEWVL